MLATKNRLAKKKDIEAVFRNGKKVFSQVFNIRYLPNNLAECRFAVVVSNRISKKATQRNYLKRKIREIIRLNLSKFSNNLDIVIIAMAPSLKMDYGQLEKELITTLIKYKILLK